MNPTCAPPRPSHDVKEMGSMIVSVNLRVVLPCSQKLLSFSLPKTARKRPENSRIAKTRPKDHLRIIDHLKRDVECSPQIFAADDAVDGR